MISTAFALLKSDPGHALGRVEVSCAGCHQQQTLEWVMNHGSPCIRYSECGAFPDLRTILVCTDPGEVGEICRAHICHTEFDAATAHTVLCYERGHEYTEPTARWFLWDGGPVDWDEVLFPNRLAADCPRCENGPNEPCGCFFGERPLSAVVLVGVRCPGCNGKGRQSGVRLLHTTTGSRAETDWGCWRCKGSGRVPAAMLDWIKSGEAARAGRLAQDLSLGEAARAMKVKPSVISDIEHGRIPPLTQRNAVAEAREAAARAGVQFGPGEALTLP